MRLLFVCMNNRAAGNNRPAVVITTVFRNFFYTSHFVISRITLGSVSSYSRGVPELKMFNFEICRWNQERRSLVRRSVELPNSEYFAYLLLRKSEFTRKICCLKKKLINICTDCYVIYILRCNDTRIGKTEINPPMSDLGILLLQCETSTDIP